MNLLEASHSAQKEIQSLEEANATLVREVRELASWADTMKESGEESRQQREAATTATKASVDAMQAASKDALKYKQLVRNSHLVLRIIIVFMCFAPNTF